MNFTNILEQTAVEIESKTQSFHFNTKDLPDINDFTTDIVGHQKFNKLFELLLSVDRNAIYLFEIDTIENCQSLVSYFKEVRSELHAHRTVPPTNKNSDSKVLYVGKRQGGKKKDGWTHIAGRMIHHLGYYKIGSTQGLQLVHWAKEKNITMTLKVYKFDSLSNDHLKAIENIMAGYLKPMLGRH